MQSIPELKTKNLLITVLNPKDYLLLSEYEKKNNRHLAKWEPLRDPAYFNHAQTKGRVQNNYTGFLAGNSICLVGLNPERNEIIASCSFTNIVYGVFQACHLGFSVSENYQGKGLMFEILQASLNYVFTEFDLHRVMANYMVTNVRSAKLLENLGFKQEGLAESYLKISGSWQDHVLTAKINPSHINR
ncbi:MAG: GNAT family N-acetyltransferase [Alteromonadaceae bacterium]|nr:GNAT family N-acetyltransferase [Alteromonadaceae bacterium]